MRRRNPGPAAPGQLPEPGELIEVYWGGDRRYYKGKVASFDHATNTHRVEYVDGDVENLDLTTERWRSSQENLKLNRTRGDQAKKKRSDGEESSGAPDGEEEGDSVSGADLGDHKQGDIPAKTENEKLRSKRRMKTKRLEDISQPRLSTDSIPNITQGPSKPAASQLAVDPDGKDGPSTGAPVAMKQTRVARWPGQAVRKSIPFTKWYTSNPDAAAANKVLDTGDNVSKQSNVPLKVGSPSAKARSKSASRKVTNVTKTSDLKTKKPSAEADVEMTATPPAGGNPAPDAVSSAHASDPLVASKTVLDTTKTKTPQATNVPPEKTQMVPPSSQTDIEPVSDLPTSSSAPAVASGASTDNHSQGGVGPMAKSGSAQTTGKAGDAASKGRKKTQAKTPRKASTNGNPKPNGSSSSSVPQQPQSGATKRGRSPASSSEPKRPRKEVRTAVANDGDAQTGLMVKLAIEAANQAMERIAKPLEQRMSDNDRRMSEMVNSNADVTNSITAFAKRQDSIMTDCTQNKKMLEQLRLAMEPVLKIEATVKENLKEYFAAHERRTRADNEALARRIRSIETELKKSDVAPSADPRNLRDTMMAEVRNLRSDFIEEMKSLTKNVDERVASTASASVSKFLTASMPASLKDAIQEQSIKTATETVRSMISKEIPLAIERSLAPRIEAILQAAGDNKTGVRQVAAISVTPAPIASPSPKLILIPRSAPRSGAGVSKTPPSVKSASPKKANSSSAASANARTSKPAVVSKTVPEQEPKAGSSGVSTKQVVTNDVKSGPVKQIETIEAEGGPRVRAQTTGSTVSSSAGADRVTLAKSLVGRSATIWLLEDTERSAPPREPGKQNSWARECCTQCFKHVARTLRAFGDDGEAFRLLNASLSLEEVELSWFLNPSVPEAVDRARSNYQSWDPPLCNNEWNAEASVLRELARRFSLAETRVKPAAGQSALQVAVALTTVAAETEK